MAVHVVTDSTADIPHSLAEELGISVVPLTVHFGDEVYRDGVDIEAESFLQKLISSPVLPHTSQPSPEVFSQVYSQLLANGDAVVSIHVSAKLSGTLNSALVAQQGLDSPERVTLVDSRWTSMALGIIVLNAARAAQQGGTQEEVSRVAQDAMGKMHLLFFCDTLEYLQKGGRIGKAQAFLGGLLEVKPLITIRDGEVFPVERVRTRGRALERLRQWGEEFTPIREFCVLHAGSEADALALHSHLAARFPQAISHFGHIGAVVATHAGPGLVGLAVLT